MAGKYTPLENHHRDLPDTQKEVTLSFEQIERIIHAKLPPSAYEYWAWWANEKEGNHVNARAWANAGWIPKGMLRERREHGFQEETSQAGSDMIAMSTRCLACFLQGGYSPQAGKGISARLQNLAG